MRTAKVRGRKIALFGKANGHYADKFNRISKLANEYDKVLEKLDKFYFEPTAFTSRVECSLALKLMMLTGARIGNEDSAAGYKSKRKDVGKVQTFGLTTLQRQHVRVVKNKVHLNFSGKRCVEQSITIEDETVAGQVKELLDVSRDRDQSKTAKVFDFTDRTMRRFVNRYVGNKFMPKDFRTLHANIVATEAAELIMKDPAPTTKRALNAEVRTLTEIVADALGNSASIAKKSYIDDFLIEWFREKRSIKLVTKTSK